MLVPGSPNSPASPPQPLLSQSCFSSLPRAGVFSSSSSSSFLFTPSLSSADPSQHSLSFLAQTSSVHSASCTQRLLALSIGHPVTYVHCSLHECLTCICSLSQTTTGTGRSSWQAYLPLRLYMKIRKFYCNQGVKLTA